MWPDSESAASLPKPISLREAIVTLKPISCYMCVQKKKKKKKRKKKERKRIVSEFLRIIITYSSKFSEVCKQIL